jgi:hypothetical protein
MNLGKKLKTNVYSQIRMLSPEQITSFIKYYKEWENSEYFKFDSLWNVKRKPSIELEDSKEEVALTESDVEEDEQKEEPYDKEILKEISEEQNTKYEVKSFVNSKQKKESHYEEVKGLNHEPMRHEDMDSIHLRNPNLLHFDEEIMFNDEHDDFLYRDQDQEMGFTHKNLYPSLIE